MIVKLELKWAKKQFIKLWINTLETIPPSSSLNTFYSQSQPTIPLWKKYARIVLPHIGLIFISCVYIVGGACIFYFLESPN